MSNVCYYRFFSKNDGGHSVGLFAHLNGSCFVGDDEAAVKSNIEDVRREMRGERLLLLKQVHGNEVIYADRNTEMYQEADALVTNIPGVAIGVMTADCAPVILFDEKNKIVGVAHAGWRGAVSGVIENTVKKMREIGATEINAVIGPCIHVESYSVDNDFRDNFNNADDCFVTINRALHFDLPKFCRNALARSGVNNVEISDIDTYVENSSYFSYRYAREKTNGVCGRNLSVICLSKEK